MDLDSLTAEYNGMSIFCVFELDYLKVLVEQRKGYLNFKPKGKIMIKEEDKTEMYATQMGF